MIQIKNSDTLIDIVSKIEAETSDHIVLRFPSGHPILHNFVSLKILKSKAKNKDLEIVSYDRIGKKLGSKLGIKFSVVKPTKYPKSENLSINGHNFTVAEYLVYQLKIYKKEFKEFFSKKNSSKYISNKQNSFQIVSLHILFVFFLISVVLFIFIYYFIVNKTYIYIKPEVRVQNEMTNFIFRENASDSVLSGGNTISIEKRFLAINHNETFSTTDVNIENSELARGRIRVYNTLEEEQTFIANTRFRTVSGLEYTIDRDLFIPAGIRDNFGNISPGTTEVAVTAKKTDIYGEVSGERANIEAETRLIIPGLDDEFQDQIYGETIEDFEGGTNNSVRVLGEGDIERAKEIFSEQLRTEVYNTILQDIREENLSNNSNIKILGGSESVQFGTTLINEPEIEVGEAMDTFELNGSISITVYTFNTRDVISRLRSIIGERTLEGAEIVSSIDEDSLRMSETIYTNTSPFEMKATYEVEYYILHNFDDEDLGYIQNLKNKIIGINKDDAEQILANDPRISTADIRIRPFFIDTLPYRHNNIVIRIDD